MSTAPSWWGPRGGAGMQSSWGDPWGDRKLLWEGAHIALIQNPGGPYWAGVLGGRQYVRTWYEVVTMGGWRPGTIPKELVPPQGRLTKAALAEAIRNLIVFDRTYEAVARAYDDAQQDKANAEEIQRVAEAIRDQTNRASIKWAPKLLDALVELINAFPSATGAQAQVVHAASKVANGYDRELP